MQRRSFRLLAWTPLAVVVVAACSQARRSAPADAPAAPVVPVARAAETAPPSPAPLDAAAEASAPVDPTWLDPMALHHEATDELLALFSLKTFTDEERQRRRPDAYLKAIFGPGAARINDGNKALAKHTIDKARCMEGLRGVTLQTDEQKAACGGEANMVPVYAGGKPETARFCIDVFEFPNKACELPMVWASPSAAATICSYQGKRLCTQEEWNLSCRADPAGGVDTIYAYGNELDLEVCNTNRPHEQLPSGSFRCNPFTAQTTWGSCATETEPTGAYPKCRSRFGVYDQHGNVAEIMTRKDPEKGLVSQLKGSAFFYVDVFRKHDEQQAKNAVRETYPDHCNFDPRWHVEPMSSALHVNYHLGFRCCKGIETKP